MVFFITSVPVPIRLESTGLELTLIAPQMVTRQGFPRSSQDKNVDIFRSRINISLSLVFRNSLEVLWGGTTGRARGRTS